MKIIKKNIQCKHKEFPVRIYHGDNPQYIFVTHHGILSQNTTWRNLEKWVDEKAIVINYDARLHGQNQLRASRLSSTYVKDLRDVVRWAKNNYPNLKIVTLGSSWGAVVVIEHAKKYPNEIFKAISWSIPYQWLSGANKSPAKDKQLKIDQKTKIHETTTVEYAWKFFLMLFFNINSKSYTKINLEKTADNKLLMRINRINKPKPTPVKLFWAAAKSIAMANKKIKSINKQNKHQKLLYIQSTLDTYLAPKKLKELKKLPCKGVKIIFLDEGKHAFQWEEKNNLNHRVFQMMFNWLDQNH